MPHLEARRVPLSSLSLLPLLAVCSLGGGTPAARAGCTDYGSYMRTVGRVDMSGAAYVVEVRDHIAYVAAYWGGLQVFDLSNPAAPLLIAQISLPDACEDVTVRGDLLAAAVNEHGVYLFDIADPATPLLISTFNNGGAAYGVAFHGDYLLEADWRTGLEVIHIANPSQPVLVGSVEMSYPVRVEAAGERICVMDGYDGFFTMDLSNPSQPAIAARVDLPNPGWGLAIGGDLAYFTDYGYGLYVADISDPTAPEILGSLRLPPYNFQLALSGNQLLVVDGLLGGRLIDCSDPADPILRGAKTLPLPVNAAAFDGDLAVFGMGNIRGGFGRIEIVDLSNADSPLVSFLSMNGSPWDLALFDRHAVVANGSQGIAIVDLADPTHPRRAGRAPTVGTAMSVALDGESGFVACLDGGVEVFSIKEWTTPLRIGGFDTEGEANAVTLGKNGYLYVADGLNGLVVADISDPTAPEQVAHLPLADRAINFSLKHPYLFVAGGVGGLNVIDVSDPMHPSQVGNLLHGGSVIGDVQVVGDLAYLCLSDGLLVVDVADPEHPRELGYAEGFPFGFRIVVKGNYVYQVGGDAGVQVYDVTNSLLPRRIGGDETDGSGSGVAASDDYLFVTDYRSGLYVFPFQCEVTEFAADVADDGALGSGAAWPNPSRGEVRLFFHRAPLASEGVRVHDLTGRVIRQLMPDAGQASPTLVRWDGADASGRPVPSGVYWARTRTSAGEVTHRVVIRR